MRSYELITIFPAEEELFRVGKETVLAELAKHGAEIVKEEDMGERQLAYAINKRPRGHYVLFNVKLGTDKIAPAERAFMLNPSVLKHIFVRVDE
ncbi:MAG TPA: 30S ribosomal protein S6 [Spirochaetales bacterium]|nr:30S ribosomal protein S6 [Spirochaetales bacterium]